MMARSVPGLLVGRGHAAPPPAVLGHLVDQHADHLLGFPGPSKTRVMLSIISRFCPASRPGHMCIRSWTRYGVFPGTLPILFDNHYISSEDTSCHRESVKRG